MNTIDLTSWSERHRHLLAVCSLSESFFVFCCSGRSPRLSLNQHSLYVGVVEKPPPLPLTGEQYGKMKVVTARVFFVIRGSLTSPFIFNNSMETAAPFNVVSHLTWSATHDVVSRVLAVTFNCEWNIPQIPVTSGFDPTTGRSAAKWAAKYHTLTPPPLTWA